VGIAQDKPFVWETAADVPHGSGEGVAGLALRPIAPEETNQPIPGLRPLAVENEVSQQRLGFEGGGLGQRLVVIADI